MTSSEPSDSSYFSPSIQVDSPIVPDTNSHGNNEKNKLHGKSTVFFAFGANLLIGLAKLAGGLAGKQSAMLSEALHSFADAINSCFLLIGLQKGSRAADKSHPFGYGLETTLWVTLASVFMLILAGVSVFMGVKRILNPEEFGHYYIASMVLLVSAAIELSAVQVASKAILNEKEIQVKGYLEQIITAGKHVQTIVSPTTRFVYYEDTIALFGAIIAFIAITFSQYGPQFGILPYHMRHIPDAVASILIGLMLLGLAIYLFMSNSKGLTGTAASPQLEQRIRSFVLSIHGISQIHELKTIDVGLSGVVAQLRVEVAPEIMVKDVDDLVQRAREKVLQRIAEVKEVHIEVLADETNVEWSNQFYRVIEKGRQTGVIKPREEQMLRNIYDFTDARVRDIMVPRTDVDCMDVNDTFDDLLELIAESGHSRIPVYQEDMDNVLGSISVKDVVACIRENRTDVSLLELVRPIDIYPENKPVSDLLEDFKRKRIQIAMVADEHGGFAGIVTIEDLLEEIVGEIWEEDEEQFDLIERVAPNKLIVSGRYDIDELNDQIGVSIPDDEFKTIGGFVFGLIGREPIVGDTALFEDLSFTVTNMDGHRVDKIQIVSPAPFEFQKHVINKEETIIVPHEPEPVPIVDIIEEEISEQEA